jgi:protein O-GlcNAc transferase
MAAAPCGVYARAALACDYDSMKEQLPEEAALSADSDQAAVALSQDMQQAAGAYTKRDWAEAERLCRRILAARADYFDALSLLGVIAAQTQRMDEAAGLLRRAVAARPADATAHSNYGNLLKYLRRFEEALDSYSRALEIAPEYPEAYNNRGVTLQELERFEEALESFSRALRIRPEYAEAWYNRGVTLQALGRFEEAVESYTRALEIRPQYVQACYNRGVTLHGLGRFEEALESYTRALKIRPEYAEARYNQGVTLHGLKRFEEALASFAHALQLKPDFAEAYNNRGVTLHGLRRFEEALASFARALQIKPDYAEAYNNQGATLQELKRFEEALESFARALQIKPDYADAYNNRGATLKELKRFEEALESFARALQIRPEFAAACYNRGNALQELKRFDEALDSYARALQINPGYEWLLGMWLHTKMQLCDWSNFDSSVADLAANIQQGRKSAPSFPALALIDRLPLQRRAAEIFVDARYRVSHSLPSIGKRARREKIRIGYFSADFRDHPVAYLIAELFERHDRKKFELVAFSYGPDSRDDMRKRLSAAFERFLDVRTKSDIEVARSARDLQVDIAVDLTGLTESGRSGIFSCRAAPIQVNYLGYPGTIGAQFIDYIIADRMLIPPEARQHYAEKIVYLPNSYQVNDRKRQIADRRFTRAELGLPATGFVFCCFNNPYKITPGTFAGWMRILRQVDDSVLWLAGTNETAASNLRKEAEARGVNGGRLHFARRVASPAEHLARYRAADLFIDTLPYNAHATASDALWAGLPVLTLVGESYAARVGASLLHAIGLPELVTATQPQYEAMAIELANSPGRLRGIAERLHANRLTTPLFDTQLFTGHLEDAYTQMYERYQADLGPDEIRV